MAFHRTSDRIGLAMANCVECGDKLGWRNQTGICLRCRDNKNCSNCGKKLSRQTGQSTGICNSCLVTERNHSKLGIPRPQQQGANSWHWKGDKAKYGSRHTRVSKARGRAALRKCSFCQNMAQEWAQIHGTTGLGIEHYVPMCCSCHQKYDSHWNEKTRAKVSASLKLAYAEGRR
jgi:hypothetical protein